MIAYFDTSAIVPLIIEEPGSEACASAWDDASRVSSTRLLYVEARAALAQARRTGRATARQVRAAVGELDERYAEFDLIEVDDTLVRGAGELADAHGLRGYDAVHLAAATQIAADDLVLVAGDRILLAAAAAVGISTVPVA